MYLPFFGRAKNARVAREKRYIFDRERGVNGKKEIVARESLENKKEPKRNNRIRLFLFCMKFYATIFWPLTPRANRANLAQTEKAKISEGANQASMKKYLKNG